MHTTELTGLSADLLGVAAVCKEIRHLSSSAVQSLDEERRKLLSTHNVSRKLFFDPFVSIPDISRVLHLRDEDESFFLVNAYQQRMEPACARGETAVRNS